MKAELLKTLQELSFTEYEAKAYLALIEKSPLSGYAVARQSGVPRSKIYEVLEGMVARGEVLVSYGDPVQYAPLPPEELVALRRKKAEQTFAAAERGLSDYTSASAHRELIWDITGREEILARARQVIARAKKRVMVAVWGEDAPELEQELAAAAARGVEVVVVGYGAPAYTFGRVYEHGLAENVMHEAGGRWLTLSGDTEEIIVGMVSAGPQSRAAWTSHPGIARLITEQIKHDIYILEMLEAHREGLEASFGPNLLNLRERFTAR